MRRQLHAALVTALTAGSLWADSTINESNQYAYGANAGWINCRGDVAHGAVIGEYYCSGYLYGANIGWIWLGDGKPADGIQYGNKAADDCGVNHDGRGNLSGYAYGANVGWIMFETNYGRPRVSLLTGNLSGFAYGANIGWISLSNARACVETDALRDADLDGDGIPDPYEFVHAHDLNVLTATGDADGDGVSDVEESIADTDPLASGDHLRVTALNELAGGATSRVSWLSRETRLYCVEKGGAATNNATWDDSGLGLQSPDAGDRTTREFPDPPAPARFFRVKAVRPPGT